jgi:hypothetical protein
VPFWVEAGDDFGGSDDSFTRRRGKTLKEGIRTVLGLRWARQDGRAGVTAALRRAMPVLRVTARYNMMRSLRTRRTAR